MTDIPISMIVAINKLGFIGNEDGDLIVKCSRDLQRFKELSKNGVLVMGRKTYESLPKAFSDRSFVVVTRNAREIKHPPGHKPNQTLCVGDINNALEAAHRLAERQGKERIVIAGGTDIFARYLLDVETVYLTRFDNDEFGGARFPIDQFDKMIANERLVQSNEYSFYDGEMKVTFEDYQLSSAVENRVGDFVKLRNGIRFRLSELSAIAPLEDTIMLVIKGAAFHITEHEAHLDTLLQELDRLIEEEAMSVRNDDLDTEGPIHFQTDTIQLCANGSKV